MTNTEQQAQQIGKKMGFIDPISIAAIISAITGLFTMVKGCLKPTPVDPTPPTLSEYAKQHYDSATGKYDNDVVATARHQIVLHFKKRKLRIKRPKATAMAIEMLDRARTKPSVVGICMGESP
jgi:hypothetical protein